MIIIIIISLVLLLCNNVNALNDKQNLKLRIDESLSSIDDCVSNIVYNKADGSITRCRVPMDITTIKVDVAGAMGGTSINYGKGGNGGRVVSDLTVVPGEILCLVVGGAGGTARDGGRGGENGGGNGGDFRGGGGGGASHIARNECTLSDRIVVAGGGGGKSSIDCDGGDGGGLIGGSSASDNCIAVSGGTQDAAGGVNPPGIPGDFGIGGNGTSYCGGGGGGFYGGAGGVFDNNISLESGGGGGSSMSIGSNTSMFAGYNPGDGYIKLFFNRVLTPPAKYNIVLIMTDDQGYSDIGYRDPTFSTPNIDNLAKTGIRLERMYGQATCSPARAALLTGQYVNRMDISGFPYLPGDNRSLSLDFKLLPQYLKQQGYRTVGIGKWHLGMKSIEEYPTKRGFDSYFGHIFNPDYNTYILANENSNLYGRDLFENVTPAQDFFESDIYLTQLVGMKAVEYIDAHPDPKIPLFMYLPFSAPHDPLQAPAKYRQRCSNVISNPTALIAFRRVICMMIAAVDDAVGDVVAALNRKKMLDDTIFIYTSDNGGVTAFGAEVGGFNGQKGSLLEGGVRVPGFIGGIPISQSPSSGLLFDGLVHLTDIFATVMNISGVNSSSYFTDGQNLLNGVHLNPNFNRSEIDLGYLDYPYNGNGFGVVVESQGHFWKYTYRPNTIEWNRYTDQLLNDVYLFDLTNDPTESINLLNNFSELRATAEASIPNFLDINISNINITTRRLRGYPSPLNHSFPLSERRTTVPLPELKPLNEELSCVKRTVVISDPLFVIPNRKVFVALDIIGIKYDIKDVFVPGDFSGGSLSNYSTVLILPLINSLYSYLTESDMNSLLQFTNSDGTLVLLGSSHDNDGNDVEFLNGLFGYSLTHDGSGSPPCSAGFSATRTVEAASTPFAYEDSKLFHKDALYCLNTDSLPDGAVSVYTVSKMSYVSLFEGNSVVYLGYNFDRTGRSGAWNKILEAAVDSSLSNSCTATTASISIYREALERSIARVDAIKAYSVAFQTEIDGYIWYLEQYRPTDNGCWYPRTGPNTDVDCLIRPNITFSDVLIPRAFPLSENSSSTFFGEIF